MVCDAAPTIATICERPLRQVKQTSDALSAATTSYPRHKLNTDKTSENWSV